MHQPMAWTDHRTDESVMVATTEARLEYQEKPGHRSRSRGSRVNGGSMNADRSKRRWRCKRNREVQITRGASNKKPRDRNRGLHGEYWGLLDKSILNACIGSVPLCILHRPDSSVRLRLGPSANNLPRNPSRYRLLTIVPETQSMAICSMNNSH